MTQASAGVRSSTIHQKTDQKNGNAAITSVEAVPLWCQLNATAAVLMAVRAGRSWTTAQLAIDPAIRPGVQALSFAVLRHYGTALALRALLAPRTPTAIADALLCSVLALALESTGKGENTDRDNAGVSYAAHTLVSQAVEAAKRNPGTKAQANFINACLRRFLRESETLVGLAKRQPQAQWNHPLWWIQRAKQDYPEQWQELLQANALAAPMTLRINTTQSSRDEYKLALAALNLEAIEVADSGLQLSRSAYVPGLPGFSKGWFSVQDEAAQLAAPMLLCALHDHTSIKGTLRILDACAAPGGKTAHLLEYAATHDLSIEVLALDVDALRCQRIHDNLLRLQLNAKVVTADAAQPSTWWDGRPFDAILLDAPCTASGIVRRHPDIRWLRREADIVQMVSQQKALLDALWPLLKPGAPLLYCTCSIFKAEGQVQIQTFLAHNTDAALLPSPGHLLAQSPPQIEALRDNHRGGHDGFYYALLRKTSPL
jgi:16S rRNA (cytosine967-C5)-methyltransferase